MDSQTASFDFSELLQHCRVSHNAVKRSFDICFSLAVMIIFSPVFLLIALAIMVSSPGSVLYSHQRIGRSGTPFACWKFRSMYPDADARLRELLESDIDLKEEWMQTRKLKNDPRVTPFGKFIRKTSLDEIPQFWNVLRGDLSVVGPRPVVKDELVKFYGRKTPIILSVRPGLTGPWQVSGRSNMSYEERVRLDAEYVANRTFLGDLYLILKTIPAMLSSRGAY
jgi:exopolysaccharide production protein ExoY